MPWTTGEVLPDEHHFLVVIRHPTIFTGSGANHRLPPVIAMSNVCSFWTTARAAPTNCAAIYLAGQFGHGVDRAYPWTHKSTLFYMLIQDAPPAVNGVGLPLSCFMVLIQTPFSARSLTTAVMQDGDYFTTGLYEARDSLIGWDMVMTLACG